MKIAVVTFYDAHCRPFAMESDKAKNAYCLRYGYSYFPHTNRTVPNRHPVWEKPNAMLAHFNGFDYVVWMDADATIANHKFNVADIFKNSDKDIFMSKDINGWNAGVFAVRTNNTGKSFLNEINDHYITFKDALYKDQAAAGWLMDNKYSKSVCEVPARRWNSFEDIYKHKTINIYQDGDFILHLPAEKAMPKTNPPYRVKRFIELNKKNGLA